MWQETSAWLLGKSRFCRCFVDHSIQSILCIFHYRKQVSLHPHIHYTYQLILLTCMIPVHWTGSVCVPQQIQSTVLMEVRCEDVEKKMKSAGNCYNSSWKYSCKNNGKSGGWHLRNREVLEKTCFIHSHSLSNFKSYKFCIYCSIIKVSIHSLIDTLKCCPFQFLNLSLFTQHPVPLVTISCAHLQTPVTICSTVQLHTCVCANTHTNTQSETSTVLLQSTQTYNLD
jgi:hypothetical protein